MQDVFVRIGGAGRRQGDHQPGRQQQQRRSSTTPGSGAPTTATGVGWDDQPADYGLVVNGNDVLATGLFVEHFKKYDVRVERAERGARSSSRTRRRTTRPTRPPIQNGSVKGTPPTRSATPSPRTRPGVWAATATSTSTRRSSQDHGFEVPNTPGVKFHDLLVVSLGGKGQYDHVVNNTGAPTSGTATVPSNVISYP